MCIASYPSIVGQALHVSTAINDFDPGYPGTKLDLPAAGRRSRSQPGSPARMRRAVVQFPANDGGGGCAAARQFGDQPDAAGVDGVHCRAAVDVPHFGHPVLEESLASRPAPAGDADLASARLQSLPRSRHRAAGQYFSNTSHARHRENFADGSGSRDMKIER